MNLTALHPLHATSIMIPIFREGWKRPLHTLHDFMPIAEIVHELLTLKMKICEMELMPNNLTSENN